MHEHPSAPTKGSAAQVDRGQNDRLAYSVPEAARRLGVSPMTLYREIAAGRLAAIRIRDRLLIPRVVLERLIENAIATTESASRVARMWRNRRQPFAEYPATDAAWLTLGAVLLAAGLLV